MRYICYNKCRRDRQPIGSMKSTNLTPNSNLGAASNSASMLCLTTTCTAASKCDIFTTTTMIEVGRFTRVQLQYTTYRQCTNNTSHINRSSSAMHYHTKDELMHQYRFEENQAATASSLPPHPSRANLAPTTPLSRVFEHTSTSMPTFSSTWMSPSPRAISRGVLAWEYRRREADSLGRLVTSSLGPLVHVR